MCLWRMAFDMMPLRCHTFHGIYYRLFPERRYAGNNFVLRVGCIETTNYATARV